MLHEKKMKPGEIVTLIETSERQLSRFIKKAADVAVKDINGIHIIMIEADENGDHDFSPLAKAVIEQSCVLLRRQVAELKEQLGPI